MKEKGFTLIELLAVIVILAVIALIAIPIILNIIEDSKNSSNKRSIELYAKAIENAVGNYQLKNPQDKDITLEKIEEYIEYKGNKVECNTTQIYEDGTIYLTECKVSGKEVEYTYGKEKNVLICLLVEGESQELEAKYTCTLDEERTFYVLENNESSNEVTLLMDRNYTDEEVPSKMLWCDPNGPNPHSNVCNHDELDKYIPKIQVKFGNKVKVGIPSEEQISKFSEEIYSLNGANYWTSSSSDYKTASGYIYAYAVFYAGGGNGYFPQNWDVDSMPSNGLRPIITISKTLLN